MARIKITGSRVGGSGGGEGEGKSRLEQLFDDFLKRPNPATARLFKEMLDVADPSQQLFGGNSKTGVSNQKAAQRALTSQVTRLHRQMQGGAGSSRSAAGVRRQYQNIQILTRTLSGAGVVPDAIASGALGSASAEYRRFRGAHVRARRRAMMVPGVDASGHVGAYQAAMAGGSADAHVSAYRASQERLARATRRAADKEAGALSTMGAQRRQGLLTGSVGGMEGALASGSRRDFRTQFHGARKLERNAEKQVKLLSKISGTDDKEYRLAQQHLAAVRTARQHYGRMGQGRFGRGATRSPIGSLIKDAMEGSMLGDLVDPAMIGGTAALAVAGAAWKGPNMIQGILGTERPYSDLRRSASRLSGQFGYGTSGKSLLSQFYSGGKFKPWMNRLGVTGADAMGIASAYGITGGSNKGTAADVRQIATAGKMLPFLRGLPSKELAGMARQGALFGGGAPAAVLRQYQKVIEAGTAAGVDRATSIHVMTNAWKALANAQGLVGGGQGTSRLMGGLLGSGLASMRTGAGEASVVQGLVHGRNTLLSHPGPLTFFYQDALRNNPHAFTTASGQKKLLGAGVYASDMKNAATRRVLMDARHVSPLLATSMVSSIMSPLAVYKKYNAGMKAQGIRRSYRDASDAGFLGVPIVQVAALNHAIATRAHLTPVQAKALSNFRKGYNPLASEANALKVLKGKDVATENGALLTAVGLDHTALDDMGTALKGVNKMLDKFKTSLEKANKAVVPSRATRGALVDVFGIPE
ncbi:MAG: hypothetical protein M0Z85_08765 [Gammaproteobacteria bacterium]|nr:hypothetical protein [Gammaproteobacteria bacterium]